LYRYFSPLIGEGTEHLLKKPYSVAATPIECVTAR
jgi:hypothetical protein